MPGDHAPRVPYAHRSLEHHGTASIPYGWWPSSIGAGLVADGSTSYDAVHTSGETVAWLETRPGDGRTVVVMWTPGHGVRDATLSAKVV